MMHFVAVYLLLTSMTSATTAAGPVHKPHRLLVYYGYPSVINGASGDIARAVKVFSTYDTIVLGDGLEFADIDAQRKPAGVGKDEHEKTKGIIKALHSSARDIYGYICIGTSQSLSYADMGQRVKLWRDMGVSGIFFDEAGFDFTTTRQRQNRAVDLAHRSRLKVLANAYNPDDLFTRVSRTGDGHAAELPPSHLTKQDAFLLESFQVKSGDYEEVGEWKPKAEKAVRYREQYGTRIYSLPTLDKSGVVSAEKVCYAWWGAVLYQFDGFGFGDSRYGSNGTVTALGCPSVELGTFQNGSPTLSESRLSLRTDRGQIFLDTRNHTAGFVRSVSAANALPLTEPGRQ